MADVKIFLQGNTVRLEDDGSGEVIMLIPRRAFRVEPENDQYVHLHDTEAVRTREYLFSEVKDETGAAVGTLEDVLDYLTPWVGFEPGGGGAGEANTSSNVGTGEGQLAKSKVGVNLPFKTIKAGSNITVTNLADEVEISTAAPTGEANTNSNAGSGDGELVLPKVGVDTPIKTIEAGANITVNNNADTVEIVGADPGEENTNSNAGSGEGTLVLPKVGDDTPIKTLRAGTNVTITNNADEVEISATDTGEDNTSSNQGTGEGSLALPKVGVDLPFKTLKQGANVTITDNPTEVEIAAADPGEENTVSNVGTGEGQIAKPKVGVDIPLRSLKQGTNVTITQSADEIEISATDTGEENTTSNQGAGAGLALPKVGVDLPFKSIIGGSNITIVENPNDITLSAPDPGEINTNSNVGLGEGQLVKPKVGLDTPIKSVRAGTNITIVNNADDIEISASGGGEDNTNSNAGAGAGTLVLPKVGVDTPIKTLQAGANVTIVNNADTVEISASGGTGTVESVTGDGVDNTDPDNPVISYPTPGDIGLGNVDNTSDLDKPISTATQAALDLKADILDVVLLTTNQTIQGVKTFNEEVIIIDSPTSTSNLEIGRFTDISPAGYGIRQDSASGYFVFMPNATFPQIVMGDPNNVTGEAYIDVDNNRRLNLNVLDTGAGTPAEVRVGSGGLNVIGDANAANLSGTNTGDEVPATETDAGIAEVATQAEADAGILDDKIITPLKLANYLVNNPQDLNDLTDVDTTGVTIGAGWILKHDGSEFVPALRQIIRSSALLITSTSDTYVTKISQSVNFQRTGIYSVQVSYNWSYDVVNDDFVSRISVGGVFLSNIANNELHRQEPKDSGGNEGDGRGTNQKHGFTQKLFINIGAVGNQTVLLEFKNGDLTELHEAAMWDAQITIEEEFGIIGT